jgi:FlaG/FlaF family flagellin (archaellin)
MLLQAAAKKNKKGLSIIIGYVLLIVVSIVMSALVYTWLKTYVPKEAAACPDGTSLFINSVNYNCATGVLTLTVKNNGRFGIDGYFIHASNKSGAEMASIDISQNIRVASSEDRIEQLSGSEVRFSSVRNALSPEEGENINEKSFDILSYGRIYKIEIIPVRIQEFDNQWKVVSCGNAKNEEKITCG